MIFQITQKEFKELENLQKNGFHQYLLFKLQDGTSYKCDTKGGAGLAEIMRFRNEKKRIKEQQTQFDLINI